MSIYPVRLASWYPKRPTKERAAWMTREDQKKFYENAKMIVDMSTCCVCGKKLDYRYAWGMHALPHGYGTEVIWCSAKCLDAKKSDAPVAARADEGAGGPEKEST